ncbi:MAG: acyl carrier protein [Chromatiales bacterium]|nr:acyl carrier protein [Chromatiales bacterium]
MSELATVTRLLREALHLDPDALPGGPATPLLGHLPELDSMAVVELLGAVEAHYGIVIEDADVSAEVFATVGSLTHFVERQLSTQGLASPAGDSLAGRGTGALD